MCSSLFVSVASNEIEYSTKVTGILTQQNPLSRVDFDETVTFAFQRKSGAYVRWILYPVKGFNSKGEDIAKSWSYKKKTTRK